MHLSSEQNSTNNPTIDLPVELYLWLLYPMWILHCFRILMITFREIFPKYLKMYLEYSLNMVEVVDFSMPDAFAKDYLDRIIK